MRKTKIICTLGPATEKTEALRQLIQKGADLFRLNMSHATHEWVREIVPRIRRLAEAAGRPVAVLLDTQGPAIRTGDLETHLHLKPGDTLEFTVRGAKSKEQYSVDVNYPGFVKDIAVGDKILVDNGLIKLTVLEKGKDRVRTRVLTPAVLTSRRHINLPRVHVNLPPLTKKDIADVALGTELGVDFMGLSFVREKSDIERLRKLLSRKKSGAQIVAKIEDQLAVRSIDKMIESADVIMVARGDLGIECPMEELPIIQRKIVKRCLQKGTPVIVATHMLESMINSPVPTRAEITDVANAVFEQADAIMLSGETTVGKYPIECVQVFDRVARRMEQTGGAGFHREAETTSIRHKAVRSAVELANSLPESKIVVFTRRGFMADHFSQMRPAQAPIYAFTPSEDVARRLTLNWATIPIVMRFDLDPEHTVAEAEKLLLDRGLAQVGTQLVVLTDILTGNERFDSIQLRRVV